MPMQFDNPENPNIHELTTGPEIIAAMNGIGKSVDAFVAVLILVVLFQVSVVL